ncbi:SDR family oxidoreductase [filamentous cyanobacterium LEGE 11480]|uniref:SDR family oxidoreductase n=1 Tax=Romeriopsis navalis LEGE 11480 TaxID=2777977 RepID=A0A928VQL0_9CYAN|nr:SDR family oxidoreductase [Romeriopsis navalis]MBE9030790.1 SDR family oxidoreductase [Romeriopsis navalis LEGE 11480]
MQVQNSIALVTGANRGIGKAFVEALIKSGAQKVYAAARNIESLHDVVKIAPDRVFPIALDITNAQQVATAVPQTQDVNLLINNAGVASMGGLFTDETVGNAEWEMQTNYFGTLAMMRAYAPILKLNGGGAIANLLSIVSVVGIPAFSSYSASKAALHSITQVARAELASQNTQVIGVFPGPVDTSMSAGIDLDKIAPIQVAELTLNAVENQIEHVYPDPIAQQVFSAVHTPLKDIEQQFAGMLPNAA